MDKETKNEVAEVALPNGAVITIKNPKNDLEEDLIEKCFMFPKLEFEVIKSFDFIRFTEEELDLIRKLCIIEAGNTKTKFEELDAIIQKINKALTNENK